MSKAPTDRLRAQLEGASAWHSIEHHEELDSTNAEAHRRARAGAKAGLVVVADHQTAGRGRMGRGWEDRADLDPDACLLVTFLTGVPPTNVSLLPLAVGLGVSDAIRRQGLKPALKWPNDVLLDGRKCAGVLVEHHSGRGSGDSDVVRAVPAHLCIGVGIDVDWREVDRDGESASWTSLAEIAGADVDRWELLADLMRSLEAWLLDVPRDATRLIGSYQNRCSTIGREVSVATPNEEVSGRAVGIDEDGALVLEVPDGRYAKITAGDVTHVRRT